MLGSLHDFSASLLKWYDRARRDLPWRNDPRIGRSVTAYQVLVSEAMLQQTQVVTVIPYFERFLSRFPTLADLAAADEQQVLRLWQGLGYYSRARNLLSAARQVMHECGGKIPRTAEDLRKLPGIGRYTAGAVASIAFGDRSAILDGNVARVLCRIDAIRSDVREPATRQKLWSRAAELLPRERVGDFNSALMELGATVCVPRSPQCLICPVRHHCQAMVDGIQDKVPAPRKRAVSPLHERITYCIRHKGRFLLEQRPSKGRWAGMWQFITVARPSDGDPLGTEGLPVTVRCCRNLGAVRHSLTHRRYLFEVKECEAVGSPRLPPGRPLRWTTLGQLDQFPLPRPHVRIAQMLKEAERFPSR